MTKIKKNKEKNPNLPFKTLKIGDIFVLPNSINYKIVSIKKGRY